MESNEVVSDDRTELHGSIETEKTMHALFANQTVLAAADPGSQAAAMGLLGAVGLGLLAYAVLFIGALISILSSAHTGGMKLAWVVFAFIAPFIGSLLWFMIGRGDSMRRYARA